MDVILTLGVLAAVVAGVTVWQVRYARRTRRTQRDDTLRVGQPAELDPDAAARSAEGKAAWMRPTGF